MADNAAYCELAQVRLLAGIAPSKDSAYQDALISQIIPNVQDMIDQITGTWWNQRTKTLLFLPRPFTGTVELPAPAITITSVTESGEALTARDYINGKTHLRKPFGGYWDSDEYDDGTTVEYPLVVVGTFGQATVPARIAQAAAELAAILSGLKKRTYINADKVAAAVTMTTAPEYLKQILTADTRFDLAGTVWKEG
jgi:hypothetical protein